MQPKKWCQNSKNPNSLSSNEDGQVFFFIAINFFLMIGILAFVVNIGLFVKAKINLQNAVDTAAFAGAATQSRQLSKIGYLNWEMRNIYKEWLFKYYVLGNLNINDIRNGVGDATASFKMASVANTVDSYNFPSVCIHFGGTNIPNICRTYSIPGIPRFQNISTANFGVDQITSAMIDTIVSEKAKNCSVRSEFNFLTANLWAYNVVNQSGTSVDNQLLTNAPQIAANRPGAWPSAFELAVRIRNLENQINWPPYDQGVCFNPSVAAGTCSNSINQMPSIAANERITKAYFSAYRNLGNESDNEMKSSLTITEIPPKEFRPERDSLSHILAPPNRDLIKYYVDLKLHMVNLATFYTAFVTSGGTTEATLGGNQVDVEVQSQCDATKVGLPVPGYPMGFVKSPDLITYYAIKGEANFIGLFNPFPNLPIKLTAYASAKPFGGRIGPNLFRSDGNKVMPRNDASKARSNAYLVGLDLSQLRDRNGNIITGNQYLPGAPIPLDLNGNKFWISSPAQSVGGRTGDPESVAFGIPNLIYQLKDPNNASYNSDAKLQIIRPPDNDAEVGLFSQEELNAFRDNLSNIGGFIQPRDIEDAILKVRAPTKYETLNYLIPTSHLEHNTPLRLTTFGIIPGSRNTSNNTMDFRMYAPLYSTEADVLYKSSDQINQLIDHFITYQEASILKYRTSMNVVAHTIANPPGSDGPDQLTQGAARIISDIDFSQENFEDQRPSCRSITGKFVFYYTGNSNYVNYNENPNECPEPFPIIYKEYFNRYDPNSSGSNANFYQMRYTLPDPDKPGNKFLFSAYRPGPNQGATTEGNWNNSIRGSTEWMMRNFYSTKFIALKSVANRQDNSNMGASNFTIISEGNNSKSDFNDIKGANFVNYLDLGKIGLDQQIFDYVSH